MYSHSKGTQHEPAPRRSAAQWATLVSEYGSGLESERDFCRHHDIKLVMLRKWRYHIKSPKQQRTAQSQAPFVKMNVSAPSTHPDAAVLCIGQDIRLECPVSYDVSSLAQLALAVHHGR